MAASPLYAASDSGSDFLTLLRRIAAGDPLATAEFLKSPSMPIPLMRRGNRMGPDTGSTMEIPGTTHRGTGDYDPGVALGPWKGPPGMSPGSPTLEIPSGGGLPTSIVRGGITPELLTRIVRRESGGKTTARGKKGERGKFQIMPATAAMYGIKDPALLENPQVAEYVARRYLQDLSRQFGGDLTKTLEAYNAGPGRVRSGNIPEASKRYAQAILGQGNQPALQTPPEMTGRYPGGAATAGSPEMFAQPTGLRANLTQWAREHGLEPDSSLSPQEQERRSLALARPVAAFEGGIEDVPPDFIPQQRFHGSREGLTDFENRRFYTATDKELARGYGQLNQQKQPKGLYQVFERPGVKHLDMDKPLPPEMVNEIIKRAPQLARFRARMVQEPARAFMQGGFTPAPFDITPYLDDVARSQGYGGLKELPRYPAERQYGLGPVMPGAQQKIYLNPSQDVRLKRTSKAENFLSTMLGEGTANAEPYDPATMGPITPAATPAAGGTKYDPATMGAITPAGGPTPGPREKLKNILESKAGPESIYPSTRVRQALSYAPMVGQIGADVAFGPEALLAKAGAAGIGTEVGEQARILGDVATRRKPVSSLITRQPEAFESASEAAAVTAAADPILRKAASLIPGRMVAQGAGGLFRKGSEAVEDLTGRIGRSLGMSEQAASYALSKPEASIPFRDTLSKVRAAASQVFKDRYDAILNKLGHARTKGEIVAAYDAVVARLQLLEQMPGYHDLPKGISRSIEAVRPLPGPGYQPLTVRVEQKIVSDMKAIYRMLPRERPDIAQAMRSIIDAGERDISNVLTRLGPARGLPTAAADFAKINQDYERMLANIGRQELNPIKLESGLGSMARKFWGLERNQVMEAMRYADTLPSAERDAAYSTLRRSYAAAAYDAAGAAKGLSRLAAMRVFISKTPEEVLEKLYGGAGAAQRGELLHSIELADKQFKGVLGSRTAQEAMINAFNEHMKRTPGLLGYLKHHAAWSFLVLAGGGGYFSGHATLGLGAGIAAVIAESAMHSASGLAMFRALSTSPTADQVGRWMARIAEAEMAEEARRGAALARSKIKKETTP